jgi:hypothetical protein
MAIGHVRPQDPSEHQASHAPNDSTPPTHNHEQDKEDEHEDEQEEPQNEDQVHDQEESIDQGGDENEGDHEGSRTRPPHPRVHQTVQRDYPWTTFLVISRMR